MNGKVKDLINFLKENPPENYNWYRDSWEKQLDNAFPEWRILMHDINIWKEIRNIFPRQNYDELLLTILVYAPDEILKEYLSPENKIERDPALKVLLQNNGQRLTYQIWNMFDKESKLSIITRKA